MRINPLLAGLLAPAGALLLVSALAGCDPRNDGNRGTAPPVLPGMDAAPMADMATADAGPMDAADPVDVMPFEPPAEVVVATYNLQNLFDTVDDPNVDEGEFTPGGRWTVERLRQRVDELARVLRELDADVITVTEVESEAVLEALAAASTRLNGPTYPHWAISATRDGRGIRLGVLSRYPIVRSGGRPIGIEHDCEGEDGPVTLDSSRPESRPIFQIEIDLTSDGVGDLVLFANHWKAKTASAWPCYDEEHRVRAARQLRAVIDEFIEQDPDRPVIGIGDFNAFEFEAPLRLTLGAQLDPSMVEAPGGLYNAWGDVGVTYESGNRLNNATNASYNFRGDWTRLDHILLTGNLHPERGSAAWQWVAGSAGNLHENFMFDGNGRPRQWSFDDGRGFSDHLPVRVTLQRR